MTCPGSAPARGLSFSTSTRRATWMASWLQCEIRSNAIERCTYVLRAINTRVDPPDFTTTWFFVRGLEGRVDSIAVGNTRGWMRAYRQALIDECDRLARELAPAIVYVTILWRDGEFNDHLKEVLLSLDNSLHDSLRPVFVTEAPAACKSLADEFDAPVIEMPFHQFALGVQQVIGEKQSVEPGTITLPSGSGVAIRLEPQTANWIAEEIELVSLGAPKYEEDNVDTFLRGGTATWTDLDRNVDARRDVQTRLTEAVRKDLEDGRITRVNLFHRPGAGGTTSREASRVGTPRRVPIRPSQTNHSNGNGREGCSRS